MTAISPLTGQGVTSGVTTNTRSSYLELSHGHHRVSITAASWDGTKTATLKYTPVLDDDELETVKKEGGTDVTFSANGSVDIQGPGYVAFDVTGTDSVAVKMRVTQLSLIG